MKTKKFVSVLCACAMLLSALPFASAAEPVSEYAGQTIPVQVVEETEAGLTSRVIQVAIPEGATKAEEDAIIYSSAFDRDMLSAFSTNSSQSFPISVMKNISLSPTEEKKVGGGNLMPEGSSKYEQIIIDITVKSATSSQTKIYFQVKDVHTPSIATDWDSITINQTRIIFNPSNLPTTDEGIEVYAKTNEGCYAELSACTVMARV